MSRSRALRSWTGLFVALAVATSLLGRLGTAPEVSVAAPSERAGAQNAAPWPLFMHDPQHTGSSPFRAPSEPQVKWRLPWWARVFSSPVVGTDGAVYVTANGYLYAFNADGTERWHTQTGGCQGTPALSPSGVVYVTGNDPNGVNAALYAINSDGAPRWRFDVPGSSPLPFTTTLGADGVVYFGVGAQDGKSGALYAVGPDGALKWKFLTQLIEGSAPAVAADGTIYIGSMDSGSGGTLYAVGPDGSPKWQFATGGNVNSSPLVARDGTVYFGSWDGKLYSLNPNGTQRWSADVGRVVYSSPALAADGTVYVGAGEALFAVGPEGRIRWRATCLPGGFVDSSPAIGQDGTVVFQTGLTTTGNTGNAVLCAVDRASGQVRWSFQTQSAGGNGPLVSSPAIGGDGLLYVGSAEGALYAFADRVGATPTPAPSERPTILSTAVVIHQTCGSVLAGALSIGVPSQSVSADTRLEVQPRPVSQPSNGLQPILAFAVTANGGSGLQFLKPVTLSIRYDDTRLGGIDEASLAIYTVTAGGGREKLTCSVDTTANVVSCSLGHLSDFEVMGLVGTPVPVPTVCSGCQRSQVPLVVERALP